MPWIPEEEIKRAREITAIEYLKKYQPNRLKKSSARNEWELTDHDSFKINEQTSQWHWKSRDIGGTSALNFLIHVDGCSFLEAVQMLKDEYPTYIPPPVEAKPKKPFVLPTASPDCRRVFRYLKERGISGEVLQRCVHLGILYESLPYHNAVFIGRDENQVARYAFLRGIYDASGKSFKMEQAGSEKAYAFCVPAKSGCRRVAVYEACVDVLAHMTLEQRQGSRDKYRLELGGISAPKEGQSQWSMKKPQALEHFLSQHPEITEIEVCTDNDFAGRWACEHIRKAYEGSYRIIENLPEIEGADWADMAKWLPVHRRNGRIGKRGDALKDKIEVEMLSPLMAEFIPDYSDIVDLDDAEPLEGPDLVQYQTSIAEKVDEINRLGMPDNQPCNLIDYFDRNKDIKEKVERITMAVKEQDGVLYGCANLTLRESLTPEEYRVVGQYLRGQYSDGWGESLEQREIKVDGGELYLHFYVGAGSDFQIQVKAPENEMQEKQPKPNPSRPNLKLLGHDGNIFSILGDASRLLRCAGMSEQANEMADRVHKSGNYYEALGIISEYVETELSDHREQRRTPRKEVPKKEDTCR